MTAEVHLDAEGESLPADGEEARQTSADRRSLISPLDWNSTFSGDPVFSAAPKLRDGGLLRRWCGTDHAMQQPGLDHHLVVVHLGGDKRVVRSSSGPTIQADVRCGSVTISPAGSSYSFATFGPVDFVHIYVSPKRVERALVEVFDKEPKTVELQDRLGVLSPVIDGLAGEMIRALSDPDALVPRLYTEGLFDAIVLRLISLASDACDASPRASVAIAPFRVRRVEEFIRAHLADDISLQMLADCAGLSRYHFCRAFQKATGRPPYAYVNLLRIEKAKETLLETTQSIVEIGRSVGFRSASQFSAAFKRVAGVPPGTWRRSR